MFKKKIKWRFFFLAFQISLWAVDFMNYGDYNTCLAAFIFLTPCSVLRGRFLMLCSCFQMILNCFFTFSRSQRYSFSDKKKLSKRGHMHTPYNAMFATSSLPKSIFKCPCIKVVVVSYQEVYTLFSQVEINVYLFRVFRTTK